MKRTFDFFGENFVLDTEEKSLSFELRKPMQRAGSTFSWNRKFGQKGIGLNTSALLLAKKHYLNVAVKINGITYWAIPEEWIAFCEKTNSILKVKSAVIYVLPFCEPFFHVGGIPDKSTLSSFFQR